MDDRLASPTITLVGVRHCNIYNVEVEDDPGSSIHYRLMIWSDAEGWSWQAEGLPLNGFVDHRDGSALEMAVGQILEWMQGGWR